MRSATLSDGTLIESSSGGWSYPPGSGYGQMDCASVGQWFRVNSGEWQRWNNTDSRLLDLMINADLFNLDEFNQYLEVYNQ